jgi:hypothetical protein
LRAKTPVAARRINSRLPDDPFRLFFLTISLTE